MSWLHPHHHRYLRPLHCILNVILKQCRPALGTNAQPSPISLVLTPIYKSSISHGIYALSSTASTAYYPKVLLAIALI
jgi:hypothetical protein